jgi:CRP/FNR family transcriptional regulator
MNEVKKDIHKALSGISYFSELDDSTLEMIYQVTLHHKYSEGQVVFCEEEACIGLYVVLSGWARAVKISADGREQVIRIVGPGDVFNEVGVLTGGVNVVTVEALEDLDVLIIQRESVLDFVDKYQPIAKTLIENLAKRVLYAMKLVTDLSLHTVECRLARYLLEQSESNLIQRKKWATQAVIASRIGTVPVVVNRAFRSFVEQDLIQLGRDCIEISDPEKLMKVADLNGQREILKELTLYE